MAGTDDNVASIGDWMPPHPSPRTLISSFLNEDFGTKSFSDFLAKNVSEGLLPESERQKMSTVHKVEEGEQEVSFSNGRPPPLPDWFGAHKSTAHGGLAERMAASGFSVPKLNTARVGAANIASSSSDVLTIPPGLSPTSLLESPVFLSNSMVQPSPTTGKFQYGQYGGANSISVPVSEPANDDDLFDDVPEAFAFKPPLDSHSVFITSAERRVATISDQQKILPSANVSVQSGKATQAGTLEAGVMNLQRHQEFNFQADNKDTTDDVIFNQRTSDSFVGDEHSPTLDDQQEGDGNQKGEFSSMIPGTPAEDGYNWRKYGQKQVKGSEYPRSYYKCTHPNCQVKKKVERSHEGHITEIIYKGAHNHSKPPPNRRSGVPSSHLFNDQQVDGSEQPGSQASFDGKSAWASTMNPNVSQGWPNDGLETISSSLVATELCDPSNNVQQAQECAHLSSDAIDVSSTLSNDEEEDDRATHGSVSLVCDGEGDETESKRRKLEACHIEMSAASRAVREPRVVVQTTSEVDILDDGYRWRKYGQKVVKGNPNPRSYYKCTNPGCTVRKHVERASHDLKSVITTYEGKHNHDVPAARNSSSNPSSAPSNTSATSALQPHSLLRRTEPAQDGLVRFDGHPPLGPYRLSGREQLGPPPSGFSFAMGQPGLTNLTIRGLGPVAPMKMPVFAPVHSYMGYHQPNEGGFVIPKGEPKEEAMTDSRLSMPNSGPVYHQMMGRLPLGPQL